VKVVLNGDPCALPDGATVEVAVEAARVPSTRGVAVAVDGEVVPRAEWTSQELRAGQRIEVLQAVQGG
jgi:sulfur carrier protein